MLILLYMFNPVVTSLRGLQQASELEKVQKRLGCERASLGSLSESVAVFDSERLKPIITHRSLNNSVHSARWATVSNRQLSSCVPLILRP